MLGVVKSERAACGLVAIGRGAVRAADVRGSGNAQLEITEVSENAVPIAIVPFGWHGTGRGAFDLAGVVGAISQQRPVRADPGQRHGVAADAAAQVNFRTGAARKSTTSSSAR